MHFGTVCRGGWGKDKSAAVHPQEFSLQPKPDFAPAHAEAAGLGSLNVVRGRGLSRSTEGTASFPVIQDFEMIQACTLGMYRSREMWPSLSGLGIKPARST